MEEFFTTDALGIFITVDVIIILLVIYFIREWSEHARVEPPKSGSNSIEQPPAIEVGEDRGLSAEQGENPQVEQIKANDVFNKTKKRHNIMGIQIDSNNQVTITKDAIETLKHLDVNNFFVRTLVTRFISKDILQDLIQRARSDQLKPGMKVKIK